MRWINVVAAMLVVGTASTALACLNDSDLPNHEREFRSQYLDQQLMTSQSLGRPGQGQGRGRGRAYHDGQGQVMSAAGIAMLFSAFGLTLVGRRPVASGTDGDGIIR